MKSLQEAISVQPVAPVLPDAKLTPAERAWDVVHWIERPGNRKYWDQETWGRHVYDYRRGEDYLTGCFANLTCRRAGLPIIRESMVPAEACPLRLRWRRTPRNVGDVAAVLLEIRVDSPVFSGPNDLVWLRNNVFHTFGHDPFPAYDR